MSKRFAYWEIGLSRTRMHRQAAHSTTSPHDNMPLQSSLPALKSTPPALLVPRPLGERRDAKQESALQETACAGRRSLAKELMADRKR